MTEKVDVSGEARALIKLVARTAYKAETLQDIATALGDAGLMSWLDVTDVVLIAEARKAVFKAIEAGGREL